MPDCKLTEKGKWMISFYTTLAFLVIANPLTFMLVNVVFKGIGFPIADDKGCPNWYGIILHSIVFFFLIRLMMFIKFPGVRD